MLFMLKISDEHMQCRLSSGDLEIMHSGVSYCLFVVDGGGA